MARKWITITLDDGSKQISNLDENHNALLVFEIPIAVVEIIVSDQPENPLACAMNQKLNPPPAMDQPV
jgi:hypothetical protein